MWISINGIRYNMDDVSNYYPEKIHKTGEFYDEYYVMFVAVDASPFRIKCENEEDQKTMLKNIDNELGVREILDY